MADLHRHDDPTPNADAHQVWSMRRVERRQESTITDRRATGADMTAMLDLPAWMEQALCARSDPELFYPEMGQKGKGTSRAAKAVCARCPVRQPCLERALRTETPSTRYGVWGGLSPNEREALNPQPHCRTCDKPLTNRRQRYCGRECYPSSRAGAA